MPRVILKSRLLGTSVERWSSVLILLVGVALLSAISQDWITRNFAAVPPPWDQSLYLYMAFKFWHALTDGGLPALASSWLFLILDRGPLVSLSTLPFFLVFGPSIHTAYLTNALYLCVMLASVFKTARLLQGWRAGLLAALICATTPALINYSRDYLLDFPMAALITAAVYTLLRSDLLKERWSCLAFGIWSGLALLAKPMAAVYLFPLALYVALVASTLPDRRRRLLASLGLVLIGFTLVAGPWYSVNLIHTLGYLVSAGFGATSIPYRDAGEKILTWNNLTYYPRFVLGYGLSFPYAIIMLCLASWRCINTWREGSWIKQNLRAWLGNPYTILVVWLLTMYVVLTVTPSKSFERYAVAALPTIAVLSGCWVHALSSARLRVLFTTCVLVIGLFNYWSLTFGIAQLPPELRWRGVTLLSQQHYLKRWFPYQQRWPIHEALGIIASRVPSFPRQPARIYVMPNHGMINSLTLMAHAEERRYPFSFTNHGEKILDQDHIKSVEFVILKSGKDQGPGFANMRHEEALRAFEGVKPSFTLLQRLPLPDGSYLELFQKQSPALRAAPTPMQPTRVVYGGAIELVGYDFRQVPHESDRYAVTYYWKCVGPVWADYAVFVHFARPEDGRVVAWQDHRLLDGAYPPSRWRPGEIFAEQYHLRLQKGSYRLRIGLYRPELPNRDPLYRFQITSAPDGIPIDEGGTAALVGVVIAKPAPGEG
jgi:4-amino-4-deoxy-L-arabinose transferase-like glycosyltransferase